MKRNKYEISLYNCIITGQGRTWTKKKTSRAVYKNKMNRKIQSLTKQENKISLTFWSIEELEFKNK